MSKSQHNIESERPLRVVIVHYRDDVAAGGSLRVGETIVNHLNSDKVDAHLVFAYGEPGPVTKRARVPCHFLKAKGPKDFVGWIRARRLMKSLKPDVIHFMDNVVWLNAALSGKRYKKLLHVHGKFLLSYVKWHDRVIRKRLGLMADGQVCITHGASETLTAHGWCRPQRTWVVSNAVNSKAFETLPARHLARAALKIPADVRLLGMICRLVKHRGCEDAIEILHRLENGWHLAICGDGPFRNELEAKGEREGVRGRMHFLGSHEDVRPVLAAMDAFLFLARYDSFGLATCEALASGVPVFGLAGDGEYRERQNPLITSDNSIFVERHQATNYEAAESPQVLDMLARHITDFGKNPQRYEDMTRRAKEWVRSRFDASKQAEAMTKIYRSVHCSNRQHSEISNDCSESRPF